MRGAGSVKVQYIPTDENTADLFTKVLKRQPFEKHRKVVLNLPADSGFDPVRRAPTWRVPSLRDGTGAP